MNDSLLSRDRAKMLACQALFVLSPFLLMALIWLFSGKNPFIAAPVWSDELDYWRALFSWNAVGLEKGYSGMLEAVPALGTLGVRGWTPILLYGWYVKLFGLSVSAIPIANALWVSLGALAFCLLRKPKASLSLMLTGFVMLYVPILLYCATSMTQVFNYGLILFYLAFLMTYRDTRKPLLLVLCVLCAMLGSVYRGVYALLFVPIVLVDSHFRFGWRMVLGALLSAVLGGGMVYLSVVTCAPNETGFIHHLLNVESVHLFIRMILSHTKSNLMDYFSRSAAPMEIAVRGLYLLTTLLCLLASFVRVDKEERRVRIGFSLPYFACFALLAAAFGMVAVFGEMNDWYDFRMLAPVVWLAVVLQAARGKRLVPLAMLCSMAVSVIVLIFSSPVGAFEDADRFTTTPADASLSAAIAVILPEESPADPFRNSVRCDIQTLQVQQELHPAMGLQYGWFTTETTGQSRWILTDHLKCVVEGYEPVFKAPGVFVYRLTEEEP